MFISSVKPGLIACAVSCSGIALSTPPVLAATDPVDTAVGPIEEVVVTARKREETLQGISAAVSVVDADRLKEKSINDIRDLQTIVPNLNVGEAVGILKLNMRALSNSTVVRGEDSEVVMHEDGAVISRLEAQGTAFFDLERIEVLRGPQGTLYGRNSTGGTINLITAKPTEELSGYFNATVGNHNLNKFEGAVAGPLSDSILGRVALQTINRDGYGRNITAGAGGDDFNDDKRWAARAHLQFNFSDDVQFLLTGEYTDQNDSSGHLTFLDTLYEGVDPPYGSDGFSDPTSRDGSFSTQPQMDRRTRSVTGTLDWQINDALFLRSITNYRDLKFFNWSDLDVSSNPYVDVGLPMDDDQISEELQLIYDTDKLHAMLGLFYYKEEFEGTTDVYLRFANSTLFQFVGSSKTEALSPFWNATYDFNDMFTIRAGGRLNDEDREFNNSSFLAGSMLAHLEDKKSFSKYTGEYGIDFHFSDNALVYYTFAQGFRSGATLVMQVDSLIIDPTTVDSNEIGLKFETENRRMTANIAIFDAKVKDLQRSQATQVLDDAGNPIGAALRVNNINDMDTSGVEAELSWTPVDPLRLNLSVAYVEAEFKDFLTVDPFVQVPAGQPPEFVQVAGNTPRMTPEWRGNLHGQYDFALGNAAVLTAGLDLSYVDKQYFDEFNREPFVESSYTLVDATLTYRPASDKWSVTLWGKNLSDEDKLYDANFSVFGQIKNKFLIPPLTFGVTASVNF
jgi:iron complex outermembrane receptor protein